MFLKIRSREFPDILLFRAFLRYIALREPLADTMGRQEAAQFLAMHVKDRIGKPDLLPPPLAPATLAARQKRTGHYTLNPAPGASDNSTLLWTGRTKNSISWGNVALRETGVGSDDPKMVWFELGTDRMPKRAPLASTARERDKEAFEKYAERLVAALFNI